MISLQTLQEAGFTKLAAIAAELGEDLQPQRHDLQTLLQDTRDALQAPTHALRSRMSA